MQVTLTVQASNGLGHAVSMRLDLAETGTDKRLLKSIPSTVIALTHMERQRGTSI